MIPSIICPMKNPNPSSPTNMMSKRTNHSSGRLPLNGSMGIGLSSMQLTTENTLAIINPVMSNGS